MVQQQNQSFINKIFSPNAYIRNKNKKLIRMSEQRKEINFTFVYLIGNFVMQTNVDEKKLLSITDICNG